MSDVRPGLADVTVQLAHDTDVLVRVEERILLLSTVGSPSGAVGGSVGLEAGVGEDDDEPLGVLVLRGDGDMLLCDELRQLWRRAGLSSYHRLV